jgi:hypothetical protein
MKSALAANITTGGRHHDAHKYEAIPAIEHAENHRETRSVLDVDEETLGILNRHLKTFQTKNRRRLVIMTFGVIGTLLFLYWAIA